jgi:hypothetical protein
MPLLRFVVLGLIFFITGIYGYCYYVLVANGVVWESIFPTLIFLVMTDCGAILALVMKPRPKGLRYVGIIVASLIEFLYWIYAEQLIPVEKFLLPSVFLWIWGLLLIGAFSIAFVGFLAEIVSAGLRKRMAVIKGGRKAEKTLSPKLPYRQSILILLQIALPILTIIFAAPAAEAFATPRITGTVTLVDNNSNCNFSIWDGPLGISTQIGNTTEINLSNLTADQVRYLTAFGRMHTTFYMYLPFETPLEANATIAYLKTLAAFNCSVVFTVWYSPPYSGFVSPEHPENWVANARKALKFAIAANCTNVVGITADAEGGSDLALEAYQTNVAIYDAFLQEVQSNASLRHPDPKRGTFDTVLTVYETLITDEIDGDTDYQTYGSALGLPPYSWSKRHYMLYRGAGNIERWPVWLYNYLMLLKNTQGTENTAPIVGLPGCQWFCEGWLGDQATNPNGTCPDYGVGYPGSSYDGVDGWDAMLREILLPKAMGFREVNVFHLNHYGTGVIEEHVLLDYYGVDKIEDLAELWVNGGSVIEFPLGTFRFQMSRDDMFGDHGIIVMDIIANLESVIFSGFCLLGVIITCILCLIKRPEPPERSRYQSYFFNSLFPSSPSVPEGSTPWRSPARSRPRCPRCRSPTRPGW